MGSNHSHRSRTRGGAARQIDVSESQGQHVGGKSTLHHWFERLHHLPGKRRLNIATLDTKIREVLWISILNHHNGAGDSPTAASAVGGAAHATEQQPYCTTCIKCESHSYEILWMEEGQRNQ
jgi:hypothetical protein